MPAWLPLVSALLTQVSGTPYVPGGDSPAGTDCSGLASWAEVEADVVATCNNAVTLTFATAPAPNSLSVAVVSGGSVGATGASGAVGATGAPGALVVGWNAQHAAVTLPDGRGVASGEGGGVTVGGPGAFQPQFTDHAYLPAGSPQ